MSKIKNYRGQAGFGLIELMLSIAIIGVLAIGVVSYFNNVSHANKVKDEVNNLNSLSGAVKNMFNSQGSYTGLTNDVILKSGSFPDRMRVPGSTSQIKHAWLDAGVTVAPDDFLGTTDDSFTITYTGVPERACTDIVSNAFRFFDEADVNGTVITDVGLAAVNCVDTNVLIFTTR